MINILFFVLFVVTIYTQNRVDGMRITLTEDLELQRQLKLINKPPIKSIETKFGHVVDCIDINKQPAFDHPLLKNHKIQVKPSFHKTAEKNIVMNGLLEPIFGPEKTRCPKGTVPIRRTTKDDLIRIQSLSNNHVLAQERPGTQLAEIYLAANENSKQYGVSGITSIYNPKVTNDQSSAAEIWVQNGAPESINKIVVGWHVFPKLYGDGKTYVYSAWTSDNFVKTGCYNIVCKGFVQSDNEFYIGKPVHNTSIYGGGMVEMIVSILKDPVTHNWWVLMQNKAVGYFPEALFSNMTTADHVGWGGRTITPPGTPSPTMGSGYLPDDNFLHACYFRNISYNDKTRQNKEPEYSLMEKFLTDATRSCYDIEYYGIGLFNAGFYLQFGGPGGNHCDN